MTTFKHAYLKQAKVQAFRHPVLRFVGGVVFENPGDPSVIPLRHSRYWKPVDSSTPDAKYDTYLPGKYIYGGPLYAHFGHFVAEMSHRILLGTRLRPDGKLLFMAPLSSTDAPVHVPPYIASVLDFFDVAVEDIRCVSSDVIVEDLLIVESGSDFGGGPKPGYTDVLAEFSASKLALSVCDESMPARIYISRSKLRHGGSYLGEKYIEKWLSTAGFSSIYPEELPFLRQVQHYACADVVIFAEGSACHGAEVIGTRGMKKCFLLGRRHNHQDVFSRILSPRSEVFRNKVCGPDLGTVVARTGTREALNEFSVSLLEPQVLIDALGALDAAPTEPFDIQAYLEEAERDLGLYFAYHEGKPSPLYEAIFQQEVREKFVIAAREISSR